MKCRQCHGEIADDSRFCGLCGVKIELEVKEVAEVADIKPQAELKAASEDAEKPQLPVVRQKGLTKVEKIVGVSLLVFVLLLVSILVFVNLHKSKSLFEETEVVSTKAGTPDKNSDISSLSFIRSEVSLNNLEKKKLEVGIYPQEAAQTELKWSSSVPEAISVDQQGLVTGLKEGAKATITVKAVGKPEIMAECTVSVLSREDSFLQTVYWLNTNDVTLDTIKVYEDNHKPSERDTSLEWDSTLFYKLEDIDQSSDKDGLIRGYNVEKKQLINADTGNMMEYEIYSSPQTNEVEKIVSIEYIGDMLEIIDYYYDGGKVNFIFKRTDSVYTPTYASPDKIGERYYFNKDVMTKWRVINEPLKVNDRALSKGENITAYDALSETLKQSFDKNEKDMINAAYNTYNTVLQAKSIGYIKGYVTDIYGNAMSDAEVKVFSNEYDIVVGHSLTDSEGYYDIPVPANGGSYFIHISKESYIQTDIYDIAMDTQFLGAYQENVYLISSSSARNNIQILLSDAFNKISDTDNIGMYNFYSQNDMVRLSNATLYIRPGMNNKTGSIYETVQTDTYGIANVQLPAGTYTGEINKAGYSSSYFTIVSKQDNDFIQSNTTPILEEDEVRIVLTWGATPYDLDSHLFTPYQAAAGDMQHIGYSQKMDSYGNNLDIDNTRGYGPETITINNLGSGSYKYYVADFTNCVRGNQNAYDMSLSGARVSVYTKDGLVQIFNVPMNRQGVIWEVFEIRNKKIIPIQRYYNNISDKPWWNFSKN